MSRYDDASEAARNLLAGFDEIDLAEIAAAAQDSLSTAQARLARFHQGELPPGRPDEAVVLTPGQWIWRWNRATPEKRLEVAAHIQEDMALAMRCRLVHLGEIEELRAEVLRLKRDRSCGDQG